MNRIAQSWKNWCIAAGQLTGFFLIIVDDARENLMVRMDNPTIEEIKSSILRHGNKFNCKVQHDHFIFPKSSSIDAITFMNGIEANKPIQHNRNILKGYI